MSSILSGPTKKVRMTETIPFTEKEAKLFNTVSALYGDFISLQEEGDTHPADQQDMIDGIHRLQDILIKRAARRTWPNNLSRFTQTSDGKFIQEMPS